jgi:hypothetical protein
VTVTAQLADGRTLEFPDGTSADVVQATVKRVIGVPDAPAAPAQPPKPLTRDNPNPVDKFLLNVFGDKLAKLPDIQGSRDARFLQGVADLPVGAAQLVANAVGAGGPLNKAIADTKQRTEQLRGEDAGSFDWSRLLGNLANPLPFKAASTFKPAAALSGRMAQGAAVGAGLGATSPVFKEEDFLGEKVGQVGAGTLIGGLLPGVTTAISSGTRAARNIIDPMLPGGLERAAGRTLNTAAGDKRDAVMQALQSAQKLVPGSAPTAAEVAAPAGSAEFSAMQRIAESRRPTPFSDIKGANEAARRAAVGGVARTDADLANAVAMRGGNASVNYGTAGTEVIRPDAAFLDLTQRPSMTKVMGRAADLAKENGQQFAVTNAQGKVTGIPVNSLHYVKMAMDDLIKNPERFGIGASEARAIGETQKGFIKWLGDKSPAYNEARIRFGIDSVPINRMQVGKELEKSLTNSLGTQERGSVFANAVRDAPQTLKRATGAPRFEKLEQVLTDREVQAMRAVVDDLARTGRQQALEQAGAAKAGELAGAITPKVPAAGMFNPKYSVIRAITNRVSGMAEGKSLDRLAQAMETPEGALRVMQAAGIPKSKADSVVAALMKQAGRNAPVLAITQGEQ